MCGVQVHFSDAQLARLVNTDSATRALLATGNEYLITLFSIDSGSSGPGYTPYEDDAASGDGDGGGYVAFDGGASFVDPGEKTRRASDGSIDPGATEEEAVEQFRRAAREKTRRAFDGIIDPIATEEAVEQSRRAPARGSATLFDAMALHIRAKLLALSRDDLAPLARAATPPPRAD